MNMHHKMSCIFCERQRSVYADKNQWLRHLATHREAIIGYIVDNFEKCPLGAYPRQIKDKTQYAGHLRWSHSKKELLVWAYRNLIENQLTVLP